MAKIIDQRIFSALEEVIILREDMTALLELTCAYLCRIGEEGYSETANDSIIGFFNRQSLRLTDQIEHVEQSLRDRVGLIAPDKAADDPAKLLE